MADWKSEEEARAHYCPPREGWSTLLLRQSQGTDRPLGQRYHRGLIYLPQEPQHLRGKAISQRQVHNQARHNHHICTQFNKEMSIFAKNRTI